MKIKVETIALEFVASAATVAQQIPHELVLLYARKPEALKKLLLNTGKFEPITQVSQHPYALSGLEESTREELWMEGAKKIFRSQHDAFMEIVAEDQPATDYCLIESCRMNVKLSPDELVEEFGGAEILRPCAFQYSQIAALLKLHRKEDKPRNKPCLMDFNAYNYFLIENPDRELWYMRFCSSKPYSEHTCWKGGIYGAFQGKILLEEGVLHLKQPLLV